MASRLARQLRWRPGAVRAAGLRSFCAQACLKQDPVAIGSPSQIDCPAPSAGKLTHKRREQTADTGDDWWYSLLAPKQKLQADFVLGLDLSLYSSGYCVLNAKNGSIICVGTIDTKETSRSQVTSHSVALTADAIADELGQIQQAVEDTYKSDGRDQVGSSPSLLSSPSSSFPPLFS